MARDRRIMVVDDDPVVRERLVFLLEKNGFLAAAVGSGEEALDELEETPCDALFVDVHLPGVSGIELIGRIHELVPETPVIVISGSGSVETPIEALRSGAFDYLVKPVQPDAVLLSLERALTVRALEAENRRLRGAVSGEDRYGDLIGTSPAMRDLFSRMSRVAQTTSNVLITGESGTGKEVVARTIHATGIRSDGPFVPVNCAAIPDGLLESELLGHVRGAFTGAHSDKKGLFIKANGGTIFLDEIGEMGPALQSKLLRVLQEREVRPVGGTDSVRTDARVIAATNCDLHEAIERGEFRRDLFYRLNVIPIRIPPLRERPEDIAVLSRHFLTRHSKEDPREISDGALEALRRYRWPGNARELENVIERTLALTDARQIQPEDLEFEEQYAQRPDVFQQLVESVAELGIPLKELEDLYISEVLRKTEGNKMKAARILGVNRATLYRRAE